MTKHLHKQHAVGKSVLAFALPYLLSCLMQTLYGMADLFIIGVFCEVESTTAVSIGSQVMHMLTVVLIGLSMGTTVLVGKASGSKNQKLVRAAAGNTLTLFTGVSLALTLALLLALRPIVALMSTPEAAMDGTLQYLTVCFLGIPFITAYNVISALFRGMGNSRTPMYFVAIACAANIGLDFLFIGALDMGAMGAALGTTLSQLLSVLISLAVLCARHRELLPSRADLRPQRSVMGELLKTGAPIALQDGFIQISFLIITVLANQRGLTDAAAVGIVEKIIGILFLIPSAMLSTVSALSARYIGAGEPHTARSILRFAVLTSVSFGMLWVLLIQFFAEGFVGLFTNDQAAVTAGGQYIRGYVLDCPLAGIHFCFSGYFCACKRASVSFVHNCISILTARIPLAYLSATYVLDTLFPMGLATTAGSAVSVIICVAVYCFIGRREKQLNRI